MNRAPYLNKDSQVDATYLIKKRSVNSYDQYYSFYYDYFITNSDGVIDLLSEAYKLDHKTISITFTKNLVPFRVISLKKQRTILRKVVQNLTHHIHEIYGKKFSLNANINVCNNKGSISLRWTD